jgi:hypothetical protein
MPARPSCNLMIACAIAWLATSCSGGGGKPTGEASEPGRDGAVTGGTVDAGAADAPAVDAREARAGGGGAGGVAAGDAATGTGGSAAGGTNGGGDAGGSVAGGRDAAIDGRAGGADAASSGTDADGSAAGGSDGSDAGGPGGSPAADGGDAAAALCPSRIFTGDVDARSDADLAQLEGVTRLEGRLSLFKDVTDLAPLRCLTSITGNLVMSGLTLGTVELSALSEAGGLEVHSPLLAHLSLPALQTVGTGGIALAGLPALASVDLPHLAGVAGDLQIDGTGTMAAVPLRLNLAALTAIQRSLLLRATNLENFDDFSALRTIGGRLTVSANATLKDVGASALETLGGLMLEDDARLATVALPSVRSLGEVWIDGLPLLVELDLRSVTAIAGDLRIADSGSSAAGPLTLDLAALTTVGDDLHLENDVSLASIAPPSLRSLGGLYLEEMHMLTRIDLRSVTELPRGLHLGAIALTASSPLVMNFAALTAVGGDFNLASLSRLANLDAFAKLRTIAGGVLVLGCENLIAMDGLGALETIGNGLFVMEDAELATIRLGSLTAIGKDQIRRESVFLNDLPKLANVDLHRLDHAPGEIVLWKDGSTADTSLTVDFGALTTAMGLGLTVLPNLKTVDGFGKLATLSVDLGIDSDPKLEKISLGALTEVGWAFAVSNNAALTSLLVPALRTVGHSFDVSRNPSLPNCQAVEPSKRAATPATQITISGNKPDSCGS